MNLSSKLENSKQSKKAGIIKRRRFSSLLNAQTNAIIQMTASHIVAIIIVKKEQPNADSEPSKMFPISSKMAENCKYDVKNSNIAKAIQ